MADLRVAVQVAVYEALSGAAEVTALAPVYQHVPEERDPPIVVVGKMNMSNEGGKGGGLYRIEFEIESLITKPGREHLTPIMAAVSAAIEDQELPAQAGVSLTRPVFEGDDDELLDDGNTYYGVQRFSLFAQPA